MKKLCIYVLALTAMGMSCKKRDLPVEDMSTPEFYMQGNVDGKDLKLEAGNNSYYMFASHYTDSAENLDVYKANISQQGCSSGCDYAISILVNDTKMSSPGEAMKAAEALKTGRHGYNDISTDPFYYTGSFVPEKPFVSGSTYIWTVTEGQNTSTYNSYSFSAQFDARKKYTIKLSYNDNVGNCQVSHTNEFRVGNPLQAGISVQREQPETGFAYRLSSHPSGTGPYKYTWDFGDGSPLSTEVSPAHTYAQNPQAYTAILRITDAMGDTCISFHQVVAFPEAICEANFKPVFKPVINPNTFASVTVKLTDPSGVTYSTREFLQPSAGNFEILSLEDYKANERGEPTKKLKVRFNCEVRNGGRWLLITNAEAVIAVSYR